MRYAQSLNCGDEAGARTQNATTIAAFLNDLEEPG